MAHEAKRIAFGPVPSRRLGQSLGINNIPPKICTYSCIYCQLGRSLKMQIEREEFYHPEEIFKEVENKIREAMGRGEPIDYLTFVPDGEPTLDRNLGKEIEFLKQVGIKIAVITNSSLIMINVGQKAPDFTAPAYHQGKFINVKLSEYLGTWVVLCFYPGDFTFV